MKTADIHTRLTINHYLLALFFDYVCFNIFYYVPNYYTLFLVKTNYYYFHVQEEQETMVFTP